MNMHNRDVKCMEHNAQFTSSKYKICAIQAAMTGRHWHPNHTNIKDADVSLRFIYRAVAMNTKVRNNGHIQN